MQSELTCLDLLINNAAVQYTPAFNHEAFNPATIEHEITVNFTAVCLLIHGLLPLLKNSSDAAILNVNSGLGLVAKSASAVYCGSKGALHLFSQSLKYQLSTDGIAVMQVFLPLVDTGMTAGRGSGKLTAAEAASAIISGIEQDQEDNHIGQVKLLFLLNRWMQSLAKTIMRRH